MQQYAYIHNTKILFSAIKSVYGQLRTGSSSLLSSEGSRLGRDQERLRDRWAVDFCNLLNRPSTVDSTVIHQIPQQPFLSELDMPPSTDEIKKAISQTNSERASGKDTIPAEIYKAAGTNTREVSRDILISIWNEGEMPESHDCRPLQE